MPRLRSFLSAAAALSLIAASPAASGADLAGLREARSHAAEALAILRLEQAGRVTDAYARGLSDTQAKALDSAARKAGKAHDPAAAPMAAAAAAIRRRDLAALDRALTALLALEAARVPVA